MVTPTTQATPLMAGTGRSEDAYCLYLQQRALARPELSQRSRAFHAASAKKFADRLINTQRHLQVAA